MALTADQILRVQNTVKSYKAEFAWGNNLCLTLNSTGSPLASATAVDASLNPASSIISGSKVHYNPVLDLDNNWWGGYGNETSLGFSNISGSQAETPNNSIMNFGSPTKFTARGWVNIVYNPSGATYSVFSQQGSGNSSWIVGYTTSVGANIFVILNNTFLLVGLTTLSAGIWYFVEVSYDSSLGSDNVKIFVNGVLDVTGNYSTVISNTGENLYIGNGVSTVYTIEPYDGYVSEFEFCSNFIRNTVNYTPPDHLVSDSHTTTLYYCNQFPGPPFTLQDSGPNSLNATLSGSYTLGQISSLRGFGGTNWTPNSLTINLGGTISVTEIWLFMHPFLPTCSAYAIQFSLDGVTWDTLENVTNADQIQLQDFNIGTTSVAYVKLIPMNAGSDFNVRFVQLELYNFVDETSNVVDKKGSGPDITITAKEDPTQNASPTPSQLQIGLNNVTNRFSNSNTSSPIYGTTQVDGRGSGVRSNVPVRITASGLAPTEDTFSQKCFYGFISCDDNPAGSTGITYDDSTGTVMFTCKSLYDLFNQTIEPPVYVGYFFFQIVQDLAWRCGVPQQFLNIDPVLQMVPFVTFDEDTGTDCVQQILEVMPFARCFETFDPLPTLNFINYGRNRMNVDFSLYLSNLYGYAFSGNLLYLIGNLTVDGENNIYLDVWVWDTTQPLDKSIKQLINQQNFGASNAPVDTVYFPGCAFVTSNGNLVFQFGYVCNTQGNEHYVISVNLESLAWTTNIVPHGAGTGGLAPQDYFSQSFSNRYIFMIVYCAETGFADYRMVSYDGNTGNMYDLGAVPSSPMITWMGGDSEYYIQTIEDVLQVAHYNGNISSSLSLTTITGCTGADFEPGNTFYEPTGQNLYWIGKKPVDDGFLHLYKINILAAFASPSLTPTDISGQLVPESTYNIVNEIFTDGNYVIYTLNVGSRYVLNITNSGNLPFFLGDGNLTVLNGNTGSTPGLATLETLFQKWALMEYTDALGVTQSFFLNICFPMNEMYGFVLKPSRPFNPSPEVAFSLSSFLTSSQVSDGNPSANRVTIAATPNSLNTSRVHLWDQPTDRVLSYPAGLITKLSIPVTSSVRGPVEATVRLFNWTSLNIGESQGAISQDITINGTTYPCYFWGEGDIMYLQFDCTGRPGLSFGGANITGCEVSTRDQAELEQDESDLISQALYGRIFLLAITSSLYNDPSFYQDLLLNGKYAKYYINSMEMPWYPIIELSELTTFTNLNCGFSGILFEVVGYTITGFKTTLQLKQYYTLYNI